MKLNLVASYVFEGKRFATTYAIDSSNNLIKLNAMTTTTFPTTGGFLIPVEPSFLMACESGKKAREVAQLWNEDAKKQGLLWKGEVTK